CALVRFVPPEEKRELEPPKQPDKPLRRPSPGEKQRYAGRPAGIIGPSATGADPRCPSCLCMSKDTGTNRGRADCRERAIHRGWLSRSDPPKNDGVVGIGVAVGAGGVQAAQAATSKRSIAHTSMRARGTGCLRIGILFRIVHSIARSLRKAWHRDDMAQHRLVEREGQDARLHLARPLAVRGADAV